MKGCVWRWKCFGNDSGSNAAKIFTWEREFHEFYAQKRPINRGLRRSQGLPLLFFETKSILIITDFLLLGRLLATLLAFSLPKNNRDEEKCEKMGRNIFWAIFAHFKRMSKRGLCFNKQRKNAFFFFWKITKLLLKKQGSGSLRIEEEWGQIR